MSSSISSAPWHGGLLVSLLLFFALLLALTVLNEQPPLDELPLRNVPEDEYARAGITLEPAYGESAAYHTGGAELLAKEMTCCGRIRQVVLVRLQKADGNGAGILSYAVNWDTSTGPESPPFGGHWRTGFTRDVDYFVLFLDADTGKHIYSLFPGSEFPWPTDESGGAFTIPLVTVRNVDGPNVFVSVWTLSPETTVVECGEEKVISSAGGGYFFLDGEGCKHRRVAV